MEHDNEVGVAADDPAQAVSPAERLRTIIAASAGNFVEWYDAGIYGITATILAERLFPETNQTVALLNTYAVFAISYLLRPLGGLIFGHIADKMSRKRALSTTILITSVSTALIGLIPPFSNIGWAAPILLLTLRLLQSMGTGGEYTTAISFVYEHGPKGRKARSVGALTSMTFVGFLVGALFATILSAALPADAYASWGWRVLFLIALPMGAVGLYLRRKTEEGPEFKALQAFRRESHTKVVPVRDAFRLYWRRIIAFTFFMGSWATFATLLTNYLPTFLRSNESLTSTSANAANLFASVMVVLLVLILSPVADRIGLRRAMIMGPAVVIVGVIPGFLLAEQGVIGGFVGAGILGACKGALAVPMLLAVSQVFPPGVRVTAGGIGYNVATSVFGGTAPFVAVALNDVLGSPLYFTAYLIIFAAVTLLIAITQGKQWVNESAEHSGDAGITSTMAESSRRS